jgi:hypothetical protein
MSAVLVLLWLTGERPSACSTIWQDTAGNCKLRHLTISTKLGHCCSRLVPLLGHRQQIGNKCQTAAVCIRIIYTTAGGYDISSILIERGSTGRMCPCHTRQPVGSLPTWCKQSANNDQTQHKHNSAPATNSPNQFHGDCSPF